MCIRDRTVTVKAHTAQPGGAKNLWAVVRAGGVTIAEDWGGDEADQDGEVTLNIPEKHFFPWSPDSPFLYDLTVGTTQGDEDGFDTAVSYTHLSQAHSRQLSQRESLWRRGFVHIPNSHRHILYGHNQMGGRERYMFVVTLKKAGLKKVGVGVISVSYTHLYYGWLCYC